MKTKQNALGNFPVAKKKTGRRNRGKKNKAMKRKVVVRKKKQKQNNFA